MHSHEKTTVLVRTSRDLGSPQTVNSLARVHIRLGSWFPRLWDLPKEIYVLVLIAFPSMSTNQDAKTNPSYKYNRHYPLEVSLAYPIFFRYTNLNMSSEAANKKKRSPAESNPAPDGDHRKRLVMVVALIPPQPCVDSRISRRRNRTTQSCLNCHTSKRMVKSKLF